ncbi:MAG: flavin reductase family protein [Promethearchaeota archaeon]
MGKKNKMGSFNPLPVMPIALIGANVNGKPNYMTAAFVGGINVKPAVVVASLNKIHHTAKGILENETYSINIPSSNMVVQTDYCGLVSGNTTDKSGIFTTFYGELETAPMIEECPLSCECKFLEKVEFEMDIAYFGEVHQVYANEGVFVNKKIDINQVNPIFYSGLENLYRTIGKSMGEGWKIGRKLKTNKK